MQMAYAGSVFVLVMLLSLVIVTLIYGRELGAYLRIAAIDIPIGQ